MRKMLSESERFFSYVRPQTGNDPCWLWVGEISWKGRARFALTKTKPKEPLRRINASRWSWEYNHGPIPEGLFVLHKCDNPACVSPGHLFLGTHADNMADRKRKGRQARGERAGRSKLTWAQVCEIRALYAAGEKQRSIAAGYGISCALVSFIVNRRIWKDDCAEEMNPPIPAPPCAISSD